MTVETAPAQASYDEWRGRRWQVTGRIVVLAWLLTALLAVLTGERESELRDLQAGLSDGSVSQVEIVGMPRSDPWRGMATVTLRWDGSFIDRYAEVVVVNPAQPSGVRVDGDGRPIIVGDLAQNLQAIDPEVRLVNTPLKSSSSLEVLGWRSQLGSLGFLALAAWVGGFFLIASGPEPWRATRWAWGWLYVFGAPVGIVAYLLFGGPLGVGRPVDRTRRLTGGWAFLLALVFFGGPSGS
jgi:hypothetical protein